MGWQARINCRHLDNFYRCRVHTAPKWIRWIMPKGRPPCVFYNAAPPLQDGQINCPDQDKFPRPSPPSSIKA